MTDFTREESWVGQIPDLSDKSNNCMTDEQKRLSDEELFDFILDKNDDDGVTFLEWKEAKTQLLSRLSQGREAIDFQKNVTAIIETTKRGTILQQGAINAIILLLDECKQSKETTDGN